MQDLLTVAGLTLPTREVVETDAFAEWQRAGCPRNNSWDADWFRAEDRATDFVAKQLYWRRRCPLGADNQNWKFAQLLVRTVLLAHEVWLKRRGKGNTLSSPSMNSGYYLSALGFVLTGSRSMARMISRAPNWQLPPVCDVARRVAYRDELANTIWREQGCKDGYDLCHNRLAWLLMEVYHHAKKGTWIAPRPDRSWPYGEEFFLETLIGMFVDKPNAVECVIDDALRAAAITKAA